MVATSKQINQLQQNTPPEAIGLIPGKGDSGALSYVTARHDQQLLDDSVGAENWQVQFSNLAGSLIAGVGILTTSGWVWKWDVGTESTIEAEKGSFSDAFKRACVMWGMARDLYPGPKRTVAKDETEKAGRAERKAKRENVEQATAKVVGNRGLTKSQKGLLFAGLKDAGLAKKRRSAVFLMTSKDSVKDMDGQDLDRVLAIIDYRATAQVGNPDFDSIWENIDSVSEDVESGARNPAEADSSIS